MTEDFYRAFFEFSMEAVLLTAPNGAIIAANPSACELFKLSEHEICDAGRSGLVDSSSPHLKEILDERARTGRIRGELILIRGDGTRFPGEISSAQFTGADGAIRTILTTRDLTEVRGDGFAVIQGWQFHAGS